MIPTVGPSAPPPGVLTVPEKPSTAVDWQALLHDFRSSGLTHAEFCRRRGVPLHAFHSHLYALTPTAPDATTPRFLPVTTPSEARDADRSDPTPDALVLILACGHRIAVAPGFDPTTLRRLLATLEGRP